MFGDSTAWVLEGTGTWEESKASFCLNLGLTSKGGGVGLLMPLVEGTFLLPSLTLSLFLEDLGLECKGLMAEISDTISTGGWPLDFCFSFVNCLALSVSALDR